MIVDYFNDFILESYKLSFFDNEQEVEFESDNRKKLYTDIIDWLYTHHYKFPNDIQLRTLFNIDDIKKLKQYRLDHFYEIPNTGKCVIINSGIKQLLSNAKKMLIDYGIDEKSISFNDENINLNNNMNEQTYIKAAVEYMKTANTPLSSKEIWEKIKDKIGTIGQTPEATLTAQLLKYSDNSGLKDKYKTSYFTIVENNPAKFWLIERKPELQVSKEPEKILKPSEFEKPSEDTLPIIYRQNPFGGVPKSEAVCVTGKSDIGKSSKVEMMLKGLGHKMIEIDIPTTTRGLLVERSLSKKGKTELGDVGYWILEAAKPENKDNLYTFVFDECHYPRKLNMINSELFFCLSKRKNNGLRTIKTTRETEHLFSSLEPVEDRPNSRIIPDNVGFIFISSQGESLEETPDFSTRVNFAHLTTQDFVPDEELKNPKKFSLDFLNRILKPYKKVL